MRSKSGGGIKSRNVKEVGYRTGAGSKAKNPGKVGQLGEMIGNHVTEGRRPANYRGEPWTIGPSFQPVKFGNEVALNVGRGGPGTGREVMKTGSQGCHGPVNPGNPQTIPGKGNKDSLIDSFGPSYRGSGRG